jgi:cell division protein FtsN
MKRRGMNLIAGAIAALALFVAACSGEERPPAEPALEAPVPEPAAAEPEPAQPKTAAADLEPTPEEIPVREDFEADIEAQVTLANYRAELDKLEQELESSN